MSYLRSVWQDHVVEKPKTYTMTQNPDGTVTLTDAPGTISQQGTPMNAAKFNNLEEGVLYCCVAADMEHVIMQATVRDLDERLVLAETQLAAIA